VRSGFFVIDWTLLQKVWFSEDFSTTCIDLYNYFQILGSTVAFLIITYQFGETSRMNYCNCTSSALNQSKALY
jgi:hypothetical protein